ncbi:MAG: 30S ribosome-binding factor RbfA [Bacteroidetes bacterium]|nr:30S ribosome-binding factor RbfA [Bacteroidota bacterium]
MTEGKRQKQVGGVLHEALTSIFTKMGLNMIEGCLVSIASVKVTPDLLEARVYLSLFQSSDKDAVMKRIEEAAHEIKRELAGKVKHQLRRMPEIKYFMDDTLEQVFKLEKLFEKIHQSDTPSNPEKNS